jgi:transposase
LNLLEGAGEGLKTLPTLDKFRLIWQQNYRFDQGEVLWRADDDLPPSAELIRSPFDLDARRGKKRQTSWMGYKVHFTEVCESDQPHLITNVLTTSATLPDHQVIATIHHTLASRAMLPSVHIVDTGYIDAQNMLRSRDDYGVDLVGPAMPDAQWQAQQHTGFEASRFVVDWENHHVTCPQGKISRSWHEYITRHNTPTIGIHFSARDCHPRQNAWPRASSSPER